MKQRLDNWAGTEVRLHLHWHLHCTTCGSKLSWWRLLLHKYRWTACESCEEFTYYMRCTAAAKRAEELEVALETISKMARDPEIIAFALMALDGSLYHNLERQP